MNVSKFMHSDCTNCASFRVLRTPEKKYVFDVFYRETLILSDGIDYDSASDAIQACGSFLQKIESHECVTAIVQ